MAQIQGRVSPLLVSRSAGAIRGENFGRVNEGHFLFSK